MGEIPTRANSASERAGDDRFRRAFDDAVIGMALAAHDGTLLAVNRALCDFLGYSEQELLALTYRDVTHPDDLHADEAGVERLLTGESKSFELEKRYLHKLGHVVWGRLRLSLVRNEAGEPLYVVAQVEDIDAEKQAELGREEAEERFRAAFDGAPIGMALAAPDGRFLQVNPALCRLVGYTERELLDVTFRDITYPDDLEADAALVERVLAGEIETYEREKRYLHKDGRIVWVQLSVSLVRSPDGEPLYFIGQIEDVTARKRTEEQLRAAEARYRNLVEHLPLITYIDQPNEFYSNIYTSPRTTQILGYTPEEWAAEPDFFAKILHPDDRERILGDTNRLSQTGEQFSGEYRVIAKDGRTVWIHDGAVVVGDEDGNPLYVQGFLLDITQRKEAEERIAAAEAEYRGLVENLPLMTYTNDLEGRHLYISPQAEAVSGVPADRWLADPSLYERLLHPDDRERVLAAVSRALSDGVPFCEEYRFVAEDDGRIVWVQDETIVVRDGDGTPLFRQGFLLDITERKRSEQELRESGRRFELAAVATGAAVYEWDLETNETHYTEGMTRTFGYRRSEIECSYDWWLERVHPADAPDAHGPFADYVDYYTDANGYSSEYRFRARDGSWRNVFERGLVIRDGEGTPRRAIGAMMDITELKMLESQLLESQKLEAVGRLAGGVAHDFNNLLTAIGGSAELMLLRLRENDPSFREALTIKKTAERASRLTGQLLAFGRKQMLQPVTLDLNEIVADMELILRRLVREDIELVLELAGEPATVRADRSQLEQVILNLVLNARDAMPRDGRIVISTAGLKLAGRTPDLDLEGGRYVTLTLTDTGVGMDSATVAHIFEPFFTTKPPGQGTGLGLATVYGIVKQSGGEIAVSSAPGEGTTFTIYLERADGAVEPVRTSDELPRPGTGETVLVTEDEEIVRSLVREILESNGYVVLEAADGAGALEIAKTHQGRIDLLLTDVVMPGISGGELAEQLRPLRTETRVLFMSGYSDLGGHLVLEEANRLIRKPFTALELATKVREVLDADTEAEAA